MEKNFQPSSDERKFNMVEWIPLVEVEIDAIDINDPVAGNPHAVFLFQDMFEPPNSDTLHEFLKDEWHF